ncbi:hypothetical protein KSS87_020531 [Heliosperma pusillum]|nr:hypothetical protein KSS87_020531 [Heliosperma pusillum]
MESPLSAAIGILAWFKISAELYRIGYELNRYEKSPRFVRNARLRTDCTATATRTDATILNHDIKHQVNHFVSTLQQYVLSQLSNVSWCRFCDSLKHEVKDMMDLESVHTAYLMESLRIAFADVSCLMRCGPYQTTWRTFCNAR